MSNKNLFIKKKSKNENLEAGLYVTYVVVVDDCSGSEKSTALTLQR